MPSQRTGIGIEDPVQLVTVDIDTAQITSEPVTNYNDVNSNSNNRVLDVQKSVNHNKSQEIYKLGNLEGENDSTASSLLGNSEDLHNVTTVTSITSVSESVTTLASEALNSNNVTTTQSVKRQLSSTSNPVVHKLFITKNPGTSQPQAVPMQLTQLGQVQLSSGQTINVSSMASGGISLLSQGTQTPTKTITISPQGILSPGKQIYTTLATTPSKLQGMTVNKIPISPAKTPTKITMIPVTVGKSPQRSLAPASTTVLSKSLSDTTTISPLTLTQNAVTGGRQTLITMSPSKVIKQGTVIQHRPLQIQPTQQKQIMVQQPGVKQTVQIPISTVHTIQGSKFQYVRLVTPSSQTSGANATPTMTSLVQTKSIAPAMSTGNIGGPQITKITLPVAGATQIVAPKSTTTTQPVQRILLPAASNQVTIRSTNSATLTTGTTLAQIRPSLPASGVSSLPPGTTILSSGGSSGALQGFALVPASYVAQLQQQMQTTNQPATAQQSHSVATQPQAVQQQQNQEFLPIASKDPLYSASALSRGNVNGSTIEPTGARPRKPCNCTKSQCLKLYCDCFANGEFCHNCNCNNCANNLEHEEERSRAIKSCLDRNPMAFHPKIGKGKDGERDRRHNKGCNCKRSGCLKNYCECYEAKIMCSSHCKCIGCKNFEESPERKTLMHLADAAEVRVQQQTAIKSKLSSQISGIPSRPPVSSATGERLPYTFITTEVAEATCACLLAQAEESERLKMPPVVQERMVIEEFGRCLMQIIESANKSRDSSDT